MAEVPLKFTDVPSWVNTPVPANHWEEVFRKGIKYDYASKHPRLFQRFGATTADYFGFPNLRTDPSIKVISSGIRHIGGSLDYLARVPAWALQGSNYGLTLFADEVQKELKELFKDPAFWASPTIPASAKLKFQEMDLEHYFECRFAGPLVSSCTIGMTENDNTMADTLVLLDRIVNHPNNLAWTPVDVNKAKTTFFTTTKEVDLKNAASLNEFKLRVDYMQQMASGFEALVRTALEACVWSYPENTLIIRVLKVLYLSPFCQGGWDKVGVNGDKVKWLLTDLDKDDQ